MSYFIRGPYGYVEVDYTVVDNMLPMLGGKPHPYPQHWYDQRWEALVRDVHRCVLCNSDHRIEVHHRTYVRWGRERLEDIYCLCHKCHAKHHGHEHPELPALPLRRAA